VRQLAEICAVYTGTANNFLADIGLFKLNTGALGDRPLPDSPDHRAARGEWGTVGADPRAARGEARPPKAARGDLGFQTGSSMAEPRPNSRPKPSDKSRLPHACACARDNMCCTDYYRI